MHTYTVVIAQDREEAAYNVRVPALPECVTWGKTIEEAEKHAAEAISVYLESLAADGETIPTDTPSIVREVSVAT